MIVREYVLGRWNKETASIARAEAVRTLSNFEGPDVDNALHQAIEDPSPLVRREACIALGNCTPGSALEKLGEVARMDNDAEVRHAAVASINKIGTPDAPKHLVYALRDKEIVVSKAAHEGLLKHTKQSIDRDYHLWHYYLHNGSVPKANANLATLPTSTDSIR